MTEEWAYKNYHDVVQRQLALGGYRLADYIVDLYTNKKLNSQ